MPRPAITPGRPASGSKVGGLAPTLLREGVLAGSSWPTVARATPRRHPRVAGGRVGPRATSRTRWGGAALGGASTL